MCISTETNNDIEGWHNALNCRAQGRCSLPFYMLIDMLYTEAKLTLVEIKLVSDGKLSKFQRKVYRQQQRKIFKAWEQYESREKNAKQLLRQI